MPRATPREVGRRPVGELSTGGNRPRPQRGAGLWPSGRGLLGGSSSALSRLRPRPGLRGHSPHPPHDGTFRVGLWSGCSPGPPGPPLPPARTRRLRGRCRPWRAPGPAPSRVAGLRGVGRGWGPRRCESAPAPYCRSSPFSHDALNSCGLLRWPPCPGAPSPSCPRSPFTSGPTNPVSTLLHLHILLPLLFRAALQESEPDLDSWCEAGSQGRFFSPQVLFRGLRCLDTPLCPPWTPLRNNSLKHGISFGKSQDAFQKS